MTIDEALNEVAKYENCWMSWNTDTGEILAVGDAGTPPDQQKAHLCVEALGGYGVPCMMRMVPAASVTRAFLEQELSRHINGRRQRDRDNKTRSVLSAAPVEELLDILEADHYRDPVNRDTDSEFIVTHLWDTRRDELTEAVRTRLQALLGSPVLGDTALCKPRFYLPALNGDAETLKAIWRGERPGRACWADTIALMECFAYLLTDDNGIIDDIIGIIEAPGMFGPRKEAMVALGKLGNRSGTRAADVIRKVIYDSSPFITAQRDRVLMRIESPDTEWTRCGNCCYGRVHAQKTHGTSACQTCLGLGCVPVEGLQASGALP